MRVSILILGALFSRLAAAAPPAALSFDNARTILTRLPTQADVVRDLGYPDSQQTEAQGVENWVYYNNKSARSTRLVISFNSTKNVDSVKWVPLKGEETMLEYVLSKYPKATVRKLASRPVARNRRATESIYSDGMSISILHNDVTRRTQAVGFYRAGMHP